MKKHKMWILSIFLCVFIWIFDTLIDYYFFLTSLDYFNSSYILNMLYEYEWLNRNYHNLYHRAFLSITFIISGIIISIMIHKIETKNTKRNELQSGFINSIMLWMNTFNSIDQMICIIDKDHTIIQANTFMENYFTDKQILGNKCYCLYHKVDKLPFNCPLCELRQNKNTPELLCEETYNDTYREWFETKIYPIKDDNEKIMYYIHIVSIITKKKEIEIQLKKSLIKAETSDNFKNVFLMNITHELKTPLNVILGFTDIIQLDNEVSQKNKEYINIIKDNGTTLLNLIKKILFFSKIQSNDIEIHNSFFTIQEVLDYMNIYSKNIIDKEKKDIKMQQNTSTIYNKYINLDFKLLTLIMDNIIDNAMKFTQFGIIEYGVLLKNKKFIEFFVKDTGIGISKEKEELLFKLFTQIDDSLTRKYSGVGIGLIIAKKAVEMLGGTIRFISNTPDKGSTFYIEVPLCNIKK